MIFISFGSASNIALKQIRDLKIQTIAHFNSPFHKSVVSENQV